MQIKNYKINSDLSVDVKGEVDISGKNLKEIPVRFNKVSRSFDCSNNLLTTLEGCPLKVGEDFNCEKNNLKNLIGGHKDIDGNYFASRCNLKTLEGSPKEVAVFGCGFNQLKNLIGGPEKVLSLTCNNNPLTSLKGCPEVVEDAIHLMDDGELKNTKDARGIELIR